jgi:hypothetical protein
MASRLNFILNFLSLIFCFINVLFVYSLYYKYNHVNKITGLNFTNNFYIDSYNRYWTWNSNYDRFIDYGYIYANLTQKPYLSLFYNSSNQYEFKDNNGKNKYGFICEAQSIHELVNKLKN